jgi:hypothetical protein
MWSKAKLFWRYGVVWRRVFWWIKENAGSIWRAEDSRHMMKWRLQVSPKCEYTSAELQGDTSLNTVI